jgi:ATP-dependent RNA helicase RhlE
LPLRENVDPWFLKPYEPGKSVVPANSEKATIKPKLKIAALLGGIPKQ